jgi:hypothetical protein
MAALLATEEKGKDLVLPCAEAQGDHLRETSSQKEISFP